MSLARIRGVVPICRLAVARNRLPFVKQMRSFIPNLYGRVGVLGVPSGKGLNQEDYKEDGLIEAPKYIKTLKFTEDLCSMGIDVKDYENIYYEDAGPEYYYENMHNLNYVAPCAKSVFDSVRKIISDGRVCLTLGGDHTLALGTISGHMSFTGPNDFALLYVDAHADLNTAETSDTGNMHGMVMAILLNEIQDEWTYIIPGLEWICPALTKRNVAYIGLRSLDPWETVFLNRFGITAFTINEVQKYGIHSVVQRALDYIDPNQRKSIHLSFDIDALDFFEAPCTSVPVRGGLSLQDALVVTEAVHRTKRLGAIDIAEVNPHLGNDYQQKVTLDAVRYIILSAFGMTRRGNSHLT